MYLSYDSSFYDFIQILNEKKPRGVINFELESPDQLQKLLDLGLHIGIQAKSLHTQNQLDTVSSIPLSRIVVSSGAPLQIFRQSSAAA